MPSFLTRALSVSSPKVVVDGEASTSAKTCGNPVARPPPPPDELQPPTPNPDLSPNSGTQPNRIAEPRSIIFSMSVHIYMFDSLFFDCLFLLKSDVLVFDGWFGVFDGWFVPGPTFAMEAEEGVVEEAAEAEAEPEEKEKEKVVTLWWCGGRSVAKGRGGGEGAVGEGEGEGRRETVGEGEGGGEGLMKEEDLVVDLFD